MIEPPAHVARWMGFDNLKVRANFDALARRHPEHYGSADDVRKDVEFVLQKPENWYPHADGRITLVRDSGYNQIPGVRVDFRFDHDGTVRIASVYRMNRRSIAKKMREKKKAIEALSQTGYARDSGEVPGWLSVADYLRATRKIEGNRSWPPGSPSGEPLKASTADAGIKDQAAADVKAHRAHLKRAFGKAAETLERTGKLKIVASDAELPDHLMTEGGQGAFDPKTGTVYLMARHVRPEDAPAIVAHEFMHDFTVKGEGKALLDELAAMEQKAKAGSPLARWFEEARARVPEDTPEAHRLHEIAAYAVQRVVAGRERLTTIRRWVSRLLGKVKAWLARRKFPWAHLDDSALAEMAIRHLKKAARRAGAEQRRVNKSSGVLASRDDFVRASDGAVDFGEIPDADGLRGGKIRLTVGEHDTETGRGFGLRHIEAAHGREIRNAGYRDAVAFVHAVASGFDRILAGKNGRVVLVKDAARNGVLVVEFRRVHGHYTVTTGRVQSRAPKGKLL
ncbi:MAG: hypothetical protein R8K47_02820, partial [Mariprofundaceae bacterium]